MFGWLILTWWRFGRNGFDGVWVNTEFGESFAACLSMRLGCLGVASGLVGLPIGFVLVKLLSAAGRQPDRFHVDVGRSPDLFHR